MTASLILRQLASYPRQNGVAAALRELGTTGTHLIYAQLAGGSGTAPRGASRELNKGESTQQPSSGGVHP